MPPHRRRRPVQPATRVRLPRAARPRPTAGSPAAGSGPDQAAGGVATNGAGTDDLITGDLGTGDLGTGEADVDEEFEPAGDEAAAAAETRDEDDDDEDEGGWPGEDLGPARGAAQAGAPTREPLLLPVCLGVVAVALGGLAVWFAVKSGGTSSAGGLGPGTTNEAVVNRAATAQVTKQIDSAVDTIFSYNYADTAKTAQAARNLITGQAQQQYAALFKVVQQEAPSEKLVLTTTVTNSGVEMLNSYNARLLIFANQEDTGATKASSTEAGAMFAVTAVRQGGQWKIESIDTFSAPG
jgi:Mce-associated membrane protein